MKHSKLQKAIFLSLFFTACTSGNHVMTMQSFYDIPLGTTRDELTQKAGEPYLIHKKKNGEEVYEYIERFKVGFRTLEERHYLLILKDGVVVEKKLKQDSPPAYYMDSYEMQTSSVTDEVQQENN